MELRSQARARTDDRDPHGGVRGNDRGRKILMATFPRFALAALVMLTSGCLSPTNFTCRSDAECVKGGTLGKCALGSCAFPDASCPLGSRWDTYAQVNPGECLCSTDFSSDPANCGGCGKTCPLSSNTTATSCVASTCTIVSCAAGYDDCDGLYDNGCEANLTNSDMQVGLAIDHCGGCGKQCPLPQNATARSCQTSACRVSMCDQGYRDCDGQFDNGCECNSGVCSGSSCAAPSCNDLVKNGNETDVDCGGANSCPRCQLNRRCLASSDCASKYCNPSKVCAPFCDSCGTLGCCFGTTCRYRSDLPSGDFCFADLDCHSCYCYKRDPMNINTWTCY